MIVQKFKESVAQLLAKGYKSLTGETLDQQINYDKTIGLQWDVTDLDFVLKHYRKINMAKTKAEKIKHVSQLDNLTNRYWNDRRIYDDLAKKYRKPIDISYKEDRMTLGGMSKCADLITGDSTEYFGWFMVGTSQITPDVSDWKLYNEVARSDTGGNDGFLGFRSGNGIVYSHGGVFMPGVETADIYENAPVDTREFDELQNILARTVFKPNNPIHHVKGLDFFTSTHKVEQVAGI